MRLVEPTPTPVRLTHALPCVSCGYDLRGLAIEGSCPECGTPIERSLRGDLLRFSDPRWVTAVAHGMGWLIFAVVLTILLGVVFESLSATREAVLLITTHEAALSFAGEIIIDAVAMIGYWLVTTPDPRDGNQPARQRVRLCARWCQVAGIVGGLTASGITMTAVDDRIGMGVSFVANLVGLVGMFALLIYLRGIAIRIPNARLASHTTSIMWGYVASMGLMMLTMLFAVMLTTVGGVASAGFAVIGMVGCVAGVGLLVFAIWGVVLLVWYRHELTREAEVAQQVFA